MPDGSIFDRLKCLDCDGTGRAGPRECRECDGTGCADPVIRIRQYSNQGWASTTAKQAADEIERLRRENARLTKALRAAQPKEV